MKSIDIYRELVRHWNNHDAGAASKMLNENVEYWDVTVEAPFRNREEVRRFFQSFFEAFPDLRFDIITLFADGDTVAAEWRMRGTQAKELEGIRAIGRSFDLHGATVCQVDEGLIVRQVDYWDSGTLLRQLGVS